MVNEIARPVLDAVLGGSLMSPAGAPSLLSPWPSEPQGLARSFDVLSFASPRVDDSSLGGDGRRLRLQPIERRPKRLVRGTVSTTGVISPGDGREASGTRMVRRRA